MVTSELKVVKKAEGRLSDTSRFLIILDNESFTKSFGTSYRPIQIFFRNYKQLQPTLTYMYIHLDQLHS